ncbi:C40 family peptidase [Gorillibacterium timonense]|uniref:C40 family peptidase n=1 Tax=Gorillibacterium timonense TaxID=1689269 RepID=UPI00071C62BE|nr:C40 family peptidase [Gorillibacterium timonense]
MKQMKKFTALLLAAVLTFGAATMIAAPKAEAATASSTASKVISIAKSYQGKVQYEYGVRNESKLIFDCSSFTQFVYKKAGIKLPWGANMQTKYGTKITKISNLKPGDLVHFSVSTPGKIGHVGIYIGNGKFIHNLSPKYDVVISDMSSGNWKNRFIQGTRVIK